MKHGDIQVLGAASYSAPLLSTLVLVAMGESQPSWVIALACASITLGAVVAAKDMLWRAAVASPSKHAVTALRSLRNAIRAYVGNFEKFFSFLIFC